MNLIAVESLDDSRLDIFRSLKKTNRTRREDLFVVEGLTVTERLLRSDYLLHSVLATETRLSEISGQIPVDVPVFVISKAMASELVGFQFHLGVLAAAHRRPTGELAHVLPTESASLVLFGDRIIDQQNVGMLIRIGSAFGADAVILGPGSADPYSRRVMRVSMGNNLFLPVLQVTSTTEAVRHLSVLGYDICATVLDENAEELSPQSFAARSVIVFGNETHGIDPEVQKYCSKQLTVSMLNGTDSVNIAIAAGIFSYVYRSRHGALPNSA